jgi:putative solute:sodium symporter small subunit
MPTSHTPYWRHNLRLISALLAVWAVVTVGVGWLGPVLTFQVFGWPFGYWMASQGALLVFCALVAIYAALMNRRDADEAALQDD